MNQDFLDLLRAFIDHTVRFLMVDAVRRPARPVRPTTRAAALCSCLGFGSKSSALVVGRV